MSIHNKLLHILVKISDGVYKGRILNVDDGETLTVDLKQVIRHEIRRWITAIFDRKRLRQVANALSRLPENNNESEITLARTVRMLSFLEALLSVESERKRLKGKNPYFTVASELEKNVPELKKALNLVRDATIDNDEEEGWITSLPLLMVVAVGYSQCEQFKPLFWEAFSAGLARSELEQKWGQENSHLINVVSTMIRFQSAPGQCARGTGTRDYENIIRSEFTSGVNHFEADALIAAMKIIGIVEEARNRKVPEGCEQALHNDNLDLSAGVYKSWNEIAWYRLSHSDAQTIVSGKLCNELEKSIVGKIFRDETDLRKSIEKSVKCCGGLSENELNALVVAAQATHQSNAESILIPEECGNTQTWCYASRLEVESKELADFKKLFENNTNKFVGEVKSNISGYTFDRRQAVLLRRALSRNIKEVKNNLSLCQERFQAKCITIPDYLGRKNPEFIIEVRLNDYIAAEHLMFPTQIGKKQGEQEKKKQQQGSGDKAGDLLCYLFARARKIFALDAGTLKINQTIYLPFPLLSKMLDITYRLRPGSCLAVSIIFDSERPLSIPIPEGIVANDDNSLLISAIANYVSAFILNRAMSTGYSTVDIGLDGLLLRQSADDEKTEIVSGKKWKEKILATYDDNYYSILADKYTKDYNTKRSAVRLETEPSGFVNSIALSKLPEMLSRYLHDPCGKKKYRQAIFIGIDIGGTLAKFQFYEFNSRTLKFCALGSPFRVLTPDPQAKSVNSVRDNFGENMLRENIAEFAKDIIETITKRVLIDPALEKLKFADVLAIGVSWPGPVRVNVISGTSRILTRFDFSQSVMENRIEDIMNLDMTTALREAWHNNFSTDKGGPIIAPYVGLLNDGNAEGTGVIISRPRSERNNFGRLSVIKIGTGTAGAMFEGSRLVEGPAEWGKMLLDLKAKFERGFTQGMANHYLSKNTLPNLVKNPNYNRLESTDDNKGMFENISSLDSIEIGLILEAGESNYSYSSIKKLLDECGIRALSEKLPANIDADLIRLVLEGDEAKNKEEFLLIMEALALHHNVLGSNLNKELWIQIRNFGGIYLAKMITCHTSDVDKFYENKEVTSGLKQALEGANVIAKECVKKMGNYLGDFIILLYNDYAVDTVITSGGVLSGRTGYLIREKAEVRINMYGVDVFRDNDLFDFSGRKNKQAKTEALTDMDFGTLGAAVYGAGEFLRGLQQKGFKIIKSSLRESTANQTIEIGDRVTKILDSSVTIVNQEYALTKKEIDVFMLEEGSELGFHRLRTKLEDADGETIRYVRWIVE